jgi:hypothetical protein
MVRATRGLRTLTLGFARCTWGVVGATCAVVVACLCHVPVAVGATDLPACEAKYATIEDVRLIGLSAAGASFEGEINPEGTETSYEFSIIGRQMNGSERPEELSGPVQGGQLGAGTSAVSVHVLLSGVQPGYVYWLEVVATNLAGTTRSTPGYFFYDDRSAEGEPIVSHWPYRTDESGCSIESGDLAAARTVQEQREKEAAEKKTAEEARSAAKIAAEGARPTATVRSCIVPSLKGDTLNVARHMILRAQCRVGKVSRPHHHRGALVVLRESPARGRTLAAGAAIALRLGSRRTKHKRTH